MVLPQVKKHKCNALVRDSRDAVAAFLSIHKTFLKSFQCHENRNPYAGLDEVASDSLSLSLTEQSLYEGLVRHQV